MRLLVVGTLLLAACASDSSSAPLPAGSAVVVRNVDGDTVVDVVARHQTPGAVTVLLGRASP